MVELERRLDLEGERLAYQESRQHRAEALVLGTLGTLTVTATIAGLAASVAVGPALVPAGIVGGIALISRLKSQLTETSIQPDPPPVLAAVGVELTRDREIIRCFSPRGNVRKHPEGEPR